MSARPHTPRLLFLGLLPLLVAVPWLASPLSPASQRVLLILLGAQALTWLFVRLLYGGSPVPRTAAVCWAILLLQAGWMAINAHGVYHGPGGGAGPCLEAVASPLPFWPGALDRAASRRAAWRLLGLAAAFFAGWEVARSPRWRRRTVTLMVGVTVALVLEGFLERAGGLHVYTSRRLAQEGMSFASFNYHANVGAFINLALALACARATRIGGSAGGRPGWVVAAVVCAAGVLATGSRAAAVIAAAIVIASVVRAARAARRRPRLGGVVGLLAAAAAVLAVVALVERRYAAAALGRWSTVPSQFITVNPRVVLWRLMAPHAMHAGPFGIGPENFRVFMSLQGRRLSPLYRIWIVQAYDPSRPVSMWLQMHSDPLQTLFEWGWLGAATWAVLIAGAFIGYGSSSSRRAPLWGVRLALGACLLHACVDFPFQVPAIQVYVAVLLGMAWSIPRRATFSGRPVRGRPLNLI